MYWATLTSASEAMGTREHICTSCGPALWCALYGQRFFKSLVACLIQLCNQILWLLWWILKPQVWPNPSLNFLGYNGSQSDYSKVSKNICRVLAVKRSVDGSHPTRPSWPIPKDLAKLLIYFYRLTLTIPCWTLTSWISRLLHLSEITLIGMTCGHPLPQSFNRTCFDFACHWCAYVIAFLNNNIWRKPEDRCRCRSWIRQGQRANEQQPSFKHTE